MKLRDVVEGLRAFDENLVICARRPWSADAESVVVALNEDLKVPDDIKGCGYNYFLEVYVAKEVLGVLGERSATVDDKLRLLIFYAENDAYPDWVYKTSNDGRFV